MERRADVEEVEVETTGPTARPVEPLTRRELEVLALLADGRRNHQIAEELVVSTHTVKKHVSHILRKLSVTNRTEAVVVAGRLGLVRQG